MRGTGRKEPFIEGLKDGIPICLGYFAVSFAFGIQASEVGLSAFDAGMLSLLNVTSAGQAAGLGVIAASGSYVEMALVQLVINIRYLLMSTALSQKIDPELPTRHRLGIAYGVTDEIFGASIRRGGRLTPWYSYGITLISVAGWVTGTVLGAAAGRILPERITSALGVALYGMFIAIVIPPAKRDRAVLAAVLGGVLLSSLLTWAPVVREVSSGTRIIAVTVAVAALCAVIWPREEEAADA